MQDKLRLVFASNNSHKLKEIKQLLENNTELLSLEDIGCHQELLETQETLEGNALQKAKFVYDNYATNCFADDTGLEIEALNGRPGVYSARYAGEQKSAEDNMNKIVNELAGKTNRNAVFRTVIALIIKGEEIFFEGCVKGTIITDKKGHAGFGYDPIFVPDGYRQTFAEMDMVQKNKLSHRAIAVKKLVQYLNKL